MELLGFDSKFLRSEGTRLWDEEGNAYLDFTAGFGAMSLGHNPRAVWEAFEEVKELPALVHHLPSMLAAALAHNLAQLAPGSLQRCFFCSSAAEAVEAALKLARAATGRPRLVYCDNAMHGKTLGALSVSSGDSFAAPFQPLLPECQRVPYGDTIALEMVMRDEMAACFIVEPIQVEGGVVVPDEGYLKKVRDICSRYGTLLILDESRTGLGRCGELFACLHEAIVPDIICLPCSLGGGVFPVGGIITTAEIWDRAYGGVEKCLLHSADFGGNTPAMAAAIAVLQEAVERDLPAQAREKGAYLMQRLEELRREHEMIKEVRGRGLLIGVELSLHDDGEKGVEAAQQEKEPTALLVASKLLKNHRIITATAAKDPRVLVVEPPLTVAREELDQFIEALDHTLKSMHHREAAVAAAPALSTSFLIVAHDDALAPWSFLQEGESMGIGIDIFKELGRRRNIMIKFIGAPRAISFPFGEQADRSLH